MQTLSSSQTPTRAYSRMVTDIAGWIRSGKVTSGERLPSENELHEQYGISVSSIRAGLDLLVQEGMVVRQKGSGTYVSPEAIVPPVAELQDAIGVVWDSDPITWHPYFSELRRGVAEGLRSRGWKSWHPERTAPKTGDIAFYRPDDSQVQALLAQEGALRGLIMGPETIARVFPDGAGSLPVVTQATQALVPYVDYDWADEFVRAMRELLRRGARRLVCVGIRNSVDLEPVRLRAALAAGIEPSTIELQRLVLPDCHSFTDWIRNAYEAMADYMRGGEPFDGVLFGDDYVAQGVLDALAALDDRVRAGESLPVAGLINRKSRIHSRLPFAAIVLDGYHHGKAIAELLHGHLSHPHLAAEAVTLRGDFYSDARLLLQP